MYDDGTYTDIVYTTQVHHHTRLALCTCCVCFAKDDAAAQESLIIISDSPLSGFIVSCSMCCSYMLRAHGCVIYYISPLFAFLYMRLTPRSIEGGSSDRALPGYPITAHHSCAFSTVWEVDGVAAYTQTNKQTLK